HDEHAEAERSSRRAHRRSPGTNVLAMPERSLTLGGSSASVNGRLLTPANDIHSLLPRASMNDRRNFLKASVGAMAAMTAVNSVSGADDQPKKLTRTDIDAMMNDLSNWGRWGKGDQLGALNLITPTKRKRAAALVKDGVTVSLSHPAITESRDGSAPFVLKMTVLPKE